MKTKTLFVTFLSGTVLFLAACSDPESDVLVSDDTTVEKTVDDTESSTDNTEMEVAAQADFMLTIENVVTPKPIFQSGVFAVPVGGSDPAPLFPGDAYEFEIDAGPVVLPGDGGTRLSFVTMFVQSNDLFYAPGEEGIRLYNEDGSSICANGPVDVTDQIELWDAGTEVNERTGGPNQKPQQSPEAADQGENEYGVVTKITNNSCSYGNVLPENEEVIQVTIENIGPAKFKVRIINVSNGTTIAVPAQGEDTRAAVPLSPGVYAVHTAPAPFFVEGEAASEAGLIASSDGLENIAEDGFPEALLMDAQEATGLIVPLSPGVWATHVTNVQPFYQIDTPDFGEGLQAIAEDGIPSLLVDALAVKEGINAFAAFDTPVGTSGPGAIGPGGSYQFEFSAKDGEHLSFTTMFVQSNDWFYSFPPDGLALFENGTPIDGDLTEYVYLYDAGTEADEYPGAGLFQVIRQSGPDSGADDPNANVRLASVAELEHIPDNARVIKVSIQSTPK
ncbi:spondin domain-containing protein [uncultured Kriegella sp.]|uniref:spondin domain-containing protein n=1 Tax=uncultured Kriegella sp. TaxID=1798910 RepID=UPI0030DC7258|tara:strand:- start:168834 stop:170345 length:1512 start_codon:yes stop_codon:yes gene_type:complete